MSYMNGYPYYQALTFDQQNPASQQTTQQTQPNNVVLGQEEPIEPIFKTVDVTLRLESRPCIFKIRDEAGVLREQLHYVLVWLKNDREVIELGALPEPIGKVILKLKHSTQLHTLLNPAPEPKTVEPAPIQMPKPEPEPEPEPMPEPVQP